MMNYNVDVQHDFKGELKNESYKPTVESIEQGFVDMLGKLEKYFDRLGGSHDQVAIKVKTMVEKVSQGYTGSASLLIDGKSFHATIDTDTPFANPLEMVAELESKLVNQMQKII